MSFFWIVYIITVIALIGAVTWYGWYIINKEGIDITLHPTLAGIFFIICPVINTVILLACIIVYIVENSTDSVLFKGKK